jgi:hypothetical protein
MCHLGLKTLAGNAAALACLVLLFGAASGAAAERPLSAADMLEIRDVIDRQIDAFRRDDPEAAFALVSPGARQAFQSAERFRDVVRMAYRAMYRAAAVTFLDPIVMSDDVVQQVQITDRSGARWLLYYAMQRQLDGSWKMDGYHLVQPGWAIPGALASPAVVGTL